MDVFQYTDADLVESSSGWKENYADQSKLDERLRGGWDRAMDQGHFRYRLNIEDTRVIGKIGYVAQKLESSKDDSGQMLRDTAVTVDVASWNGEAKVCNQVVINVSPLEYGNILLVPDVHACRPQILTKYAVELSVDLLLLSKHRGFRVGFNSLCAYASVNHLHVHAYYLDHELFVEHMPVQQLSGVLHEHTLLPARGFVLQLYGSTRTLLSRHLYQITDYLNKNEIAHNIFMTRGPAFGLKDEAAFNVALAELAGHLPIKVRELFHGLDEQKIEETVREAMLEEPEYQNIKRDLIDMFSISPTS